MLKVQPSQPRTLDRMPVGTQCQLRGLEGTSEIQSRLLELGFVLGVQLELIAKGPFGSPFVVKVQGTTVALRKDEAQCLII